MPKKSENKKKKSLRLLFFIKNGKINDLLIE